MKDSEQEEKEKSDGELIREIDEVLGEDGDITLIHEDESDGTTSNTASTSSKKKRSSISKRTKSKPAGNQIETGKRKLPSESPTEAIVKPPKKKLSAIRPELTSRKPTINSSEPQPMETDVNQPKYSEVAGEIKIAVIAADYPRDFYTEEYYDEFNSFLGRQMDELGEEEYLPNFVFANFDKGYAIYKCSGKHSAVFLSQAAGSFNLEKPLKAVPLSELPSLPVFRTHTLERDFSVETFLRRLARQNRGAGIDTSSWRVFNVMRSEDGKRVSFLVEMDVRSAKILARNGYWLFYWVSTIKFVDPSTNELPTKLTLDELRAVGNANLAARRAVGKAENFNKNDITMGGDDALASTAQSNQGGGAEVIPTAAAKPQSLGGDAVKAATAETNPNQN
jgi:hypothetical protein